MVERTRRPRGSQSRRAEIGVERRARSRLDLVTAAFRVFAEKGIEVPVIDDFITASGLSRGTFYNHFKTKDAILKAVADELAREINERILPVLKPLTDPAERVCAALLSFIDIAAADPTRGWIMVRMIPLLGGPLNEQMRRGARNDIKAGIEQGRFHVESVHAAIDVGLGMATLVIRSILGKHMPANYSRLAVAMVLQSLGIEREEARRLAAKPYSLIDQRNTPKTHLLET
jgi:AcrR family transcriptional regulator